VHDDEVYVEMRLMKRVTEVASRVMPTSGSENENGSGRRGQEGYRRVDGLAKQEGSSEVGNTTSRSAFIRYSI
jgi:hypothetical protein